MYVGPLFFTVAVKKICLYSRFFRTVNILYAVINEN